MMLLSQSKGHIQYGIQAMMFAPVAQNIEQNALCRETAIGEKQKGFSLDSLAKLYGYTSAEICLGVLEMPRLCAYFQAARVSSKLTIAVRVLGGDRDSTHRDLRQSESMLLNHWDCSRR